MGIICDTCGRDIDALGQDNMGVGAPLCEDCWGEQQSHTAAVPRREARNLRFENARLREKLDAGTEETAVQNLRKGIETAYEASRERALALTKLDECELWLGRCELRVTAAPTLKGAAQDAAIEVRCPKCGMREIWHHLPKGGDRCRWCGHLFEDFTYRKVGPSAKEGAR